jgi:hypothetical protein
MIPSKPVLIIASPEDATMAAAVRERFGSTLKLSTKKVAAIAVQGSCQRVDLYRDRLHGGTPATIKKLGV